MPVASLKTMRPGTKRQDMVRIPDTELSVPAAVIKGLKEGPLLLLTAGIHGSEYPGILTCIELFEELDPNTLHGTVMMLYPVNSGAFRERVAFIVPSDGRNLNRMFPGNPEGTDSEKIAWHLTGLQEQADFYLDLHSGDLFEALTPYAYVSGSAAEDVVTASLNAAKVLDVPYLVRSYSTTGTINAAAARGTPAILMERGGAGMCRRDEVDLYKRDVRNILSFLGMLDTPVERDGPEAHELADVVYLMCEEDSCWQTYVEPGQRIVAGQPLGETFDIFGHPLNIYHADRDGVVLYTLYPLSARKDDVLIAYGK